MTVMTNPTRYGLELILKLLHDSGGSEETILFHPHFVFTPQARGAVSGGQWSTGIWSAKRRLTHFAQNSVDKISSIHTILDSTLAPIWSDGASFQYH